MIDRNDYFIVTKYVTTTVGCVEIKLHSICPLSGYGLHTNYIVVLGQPNRTLEQSLKGPLEI